jgi:hypothetical protein
MMEESFDNFLKVVKADISRPLSSLVAVSSQSLLKWVNTAEESFDNFLKVVKADG